MTGFASLELKQKDHVLEIRIKSLNSRFLDLRCHLPSDMAELEGEIRKRIQKYIRRGNVDVSLYRRFTGEKKSELTTQMNIAMEAKKALQAIAKKIGDTQKINLDHILKVVNPIQVIETKNLTDKDKKDVFSSLEKALKSHQDEKAREGKSIVTELKKLLGLMLVDLKKIEALRSSVGDQLKSKYQDRIKALSETVEIDPQRIQQEIVIHMDRTDIHEEIVRLKEHIQSFERFLAEDNGKKLDFYTQELLREANTIGSKAQVAEITSAIVNIKCHIERVRELVQNLE